MVMKERRDVAACQLISEALRLSGKVRLRVLGSSMLPAILPGDSLIVEHTNVSLPVRGDVILFQRYERLFAHRVVARQYRNDCAGIVTAGDSLPENDPLVLPHELLGRVNAVIRSGRYLSPRATRLHRVIAAILKSSDFLTACFLWLLNCTRSPGRGDEWAT